MILRITFADVNRDKRTLAGLIGQIEIDGEQIPISTSNDGDLANTPTSPISYIITQQDSQLFNQIVQVSNENDILKLELPISSSVGEVNVRLKVKLSGSSDWLYENNFEVFKYDLGNNPTIGVRNNPEFLIYVYDTNVQISDFDPDSMSLEDFINMVENQYQSVLIPGTICYRRPFTEEITYYNATSSEGDRLYESVDIANNNPFRLGTQDGQFCLRPDAFIRQTITINIPVPYQTTCNACTTSNSIFISVTDNTIQRSEGNSVFEDPSYDTKDIANQNLKRPYWIPESQLFVTNLTGDGSCAIVDRKDAYAFLNVDEELTIYNVDDQVSYLFDTFVVNYQLLDYIGKVLESKSFVESVSVPFEYLINDSKRYEFDIPQEGDYLVYAKISFSESGEGLAYCEKSAPVDGKFWLGIEEETCGQIKIINRSFEPLVVTITKFGETDFDEEVSQLNIDGLSNIIFNVPTDGIYKISSTREGEEIFFVYASYCSLRSCLEEQILTLLCMNADKIKDSSYSDFLYNLLLTQTLLMKLNSVNMLNFVYTFLSPSQLEEFVTIKQIIDRSVELCAGCEQPDYLKSLTCKCSNNDCKC